MKCGLLLALGVPCAQAQTPSCSLDEVYRASFESSASVTLTGLVTGISIADIEVRSGDRVLATVGTTDGRFELVVPAGTAEGFLELRARGRAAQGQEFVELASWVGPQQYARGLRDAQGRVGVSKLSGLAVTPLSTARYVLVAGGAPRAVNECQLEAQLEALDSGAVLERAAVIKLIIENGGLFPGVSNPSKGVAPSTTLNVVADTTQLTGQINGIESERPGALAQTVGLLGENFCDYFSPQAVFVSGERLRGTLLNTFSGEIYSVTGAGRGQHAESFGKDGFDFTCAGDVLTATMDGTRVSANFPVRTVNGVARQVTQEIRTSQIQLRRLDSSINEIVVVAGLTSVGSFPNDPSLPDEVTSGERTLSLIRTPRATPLDEAQFRGQVWSLPSVQENSPSNQIGAELIQFAATGNDATRVENGEPLTWSVNARGELELVFASRTARVIPIRDDAGAIDALGAVDRQDGNSSISGGFMAQVVPAADWMSEAAVPAHYTQYAARSSNPFQWRLAADRAAPAFSGAPGSETLSFTLYWSRPDADTVILRRCRGDNGSGGIVEKVIVDREPEAGECSAFYRRRELTLLNSVANPNGSGRYLWMLEDNKDWNSGTPLSSPPSFRFLRTILYLREEPAVKAASGAHGPLATPRDRDRSWHGDYPVD
ncbi:hypothetical protein [Pseudomarimonas salicorniae]|uniref:Carboxypeptidase regulatory-like domain-containing protein n=1 Tax=Pseudomarimonas salicorniae TaxID=2933270 RepID=A0ABT0GD51_9GAMM|nr:hypothetical protein [Lysobacter sp. CAU 1642]MCK7592476.1 hypothetical protein [Lysobacter sp. CAU 1642]